MKLNLQYLLAFCVALTRALVIIDSILATNCIYTMKDYDWGCNSTKQSATYYSCRCHNVNWIGSVTNCLESKGVNNSREHIDHAYRHLRQRCIDKGRIDWPLDVLKWYMENATDYLEEPKVEDLAIELDHPILVNETSYDYYRHSFNHIYAHVIRSQAYQWGFIFFWVFVIVCGTILNFSRHFLVRFKGSARSKFTSKLINNLRSSISLPNLLPKSYYRILRFWPVHVPKTYESIVVALFSIYMVLSATTGYSIELPNAYMNGHIWQLLDIVGYRTALCSFGLIPSTFFFGIRNNPFVRLTGSTAQSFLTYHKWSAWGMCIHALIHSAVWTDYVIREGDYSAWAMDAYWKWGIAGTTVCFLMLFFASAFWRELAYEVFLFFHQAFGSIFILTMWYHCKGMGWMGWLYTSIAIWVYDRLIRFISVLANGGAKTAKITKLSDNLMRVVVEKPAGSTYFPGAYYYYYFLNMHLRFFQSHPFSVFESQRADEQSCYAIVVKTHKGITKKMMNELDKLINRNTMLVDVLTEGPYGAPIPLKSHEQYVFISAGIGFTPCYSQAIDLIKKNIQKGTSTLIKFVWVVKTVGYYNIFQEDMQYLTANGVDLTVFVTRESGPSSKTEASISGDDDGKEESKLLTLPQVTNFRLLGCRPNPADLVTHTQLSGSTCFVTSGPTTFVDEIRASVSQVVKTAEVRVDLYDESFKM